MGMMAGRAMAGAVRRGRVAAATLSLLVMAGCGQSDDAQGVGGLSKGEADALNHAAAMLDERANHAEAALGGNGAE